MPLICIPWCRVLLNLALLGLALSLGPDFLHAQEPPPPVLKRSEDGKTFTHEVSKTQFALPQGWTLVLPRDKDGKELPPEVVGQSTFLNLRRPITVKQGETELVGVADVTISWSPLPEKFEFAKAIELEKTLLVMQYGKDKEGKDKVEGPKQIMEAGKTWYELLIHDGPTRNDKEKGVVYLIEAGDGKMNRWKIKVRGTVSKLVEAEALKAVKDLLASFKFE